MIEGGAGLGGFHPGGLRAAPWFRKRQGLVVQVDIVPVAVCQGAGVVPPACPVLRGQDHGHNVIVGFNAPFRGALIVQPVR